MNIDPSECRTCSDLANQLAAANARCAELEAQREALSFELQALRATPWHQRMEKAEATLDRVTALADEADRSERHINGYGYVLLRALRAALTPEGKP